MSPPRWRTLATVVLPVLIAHLFLPLSLISRLWIAAPRGRPAWIAALFVACSYSIFIYLAGAWSWFGNAARRLLPAALVAAALITGPRVGEDAPFSQSSAFEISMALVLGAIFLVLTIVALLGRRLREPAIDLAFPLRDGVFVVGQGGGTRLVNYHAIHRSQRHALDILGLNAAGVRARGLYPARLSSYAIYGAVVVSPCDGVVVAAEDGFPDRVPPERDGDHPLGNHVALQCEGATIYMAHLMCGSLGVRAGERVQSGQPLARVGNSGNTTEPHLHIHAEKGTHPGRLSGEPGVPIRFRGRFLVRNDRVEVPA